MIASAFAAAEQIFTPPFRTVFWKTLGLTILTLGVLWFGLEHLIGAYVHNLPYDWLGTLIQVLAGLGLVAGFVVLIPPVSFLVAGFFFDDLADHVEDAVSPVGRGRAMAFGPALWLGAKFAFVSLLVNACALLLLFVPGVNVVAFFGANAYLLGRGFFELAALRYVDLDTMRALRQRHSLKIFLAGMVVAALAAVPIVNLLTPLFAAAFLVRVTQGVLRPRLAQSAL